MPPSYIKTEEKKSIHRE